MNQEHDRAAKLLDVEVETQRQKTTLAYRSSLITLLVTVVNASLLAFVNTRINASARMAFLWWCLILVITTARSALVMRFRRAKLDSADPMTRWRRLYVAGTALAAAAWGLGAVLFIVDAPVGARLFTGLVIAGMVAGAVPTLAPVPWAFRTFAVLTLVPMAVLILWQASSSLDWAFGSMTLIFLAAVSASARQLHRSLDVAIRLGFKQGRLAQTVRASEERYRLILQFSPAGILHFDERLVITFCNERFALLMNVERERVIGLDMQQLTDQRVLPALRAALEGREGAYEGEYVSTLTGARIWISLACTPFRGADGRGEGGIAIVQDITDRHKSQEEIRELAFFDPLTRLPNRRLMMDRLGQAVTTSGRSRRFGALMILDLDHFKRINDSQGHHIGDGLLVQVAERLATCLSRGDTIARFGGDEFVVMVQGLSPSEATAVKRAEAIAERLRSALELPFTLGGSESEYFSGASVGLTLFCGREESPELLLKQVDVALYQAKDAGRNVVRFFSPAMQASIERRAALEGALRRGLEREEFRLYYQPQVDRLGHAVGAEAVIRWLPPDRGVLLPAQFIPLAEESGLILPIGRWVLDSACAQLKAWEQHPRLRHLRLSVNVSARQFHAPDLVDQVGHALLMSGANPALLNLELTESVVLADVDTVVRRMEQINAFGVCFSLDDFGSGYSSLSYLKRLPLDQVKIDRAFVRGLPADSSDVAIVRAILAMSESLGLQVIAEGVETVEQRDFLAQHGCGTYQGHLYGWPLPIEDFERLESARQPEQELALPERGPIERDAADEEGASRHQASG